MNWWILVAIVPVVGNEMNASVLDTQTPQGNEDEAIYRHFPASFRITDTQNWSHQLVEIVQK